LLESEKKKATQEKAIDGGGDTGGDVSSFDPGATNYADKGEDKSGITNKLFVP